MIRDWIHHQSKDVPLFFIFFIIFLNIFDIVATKYIIANNGEEWNPVMNYIIAVFGFKQAALWKMVAVIISSLFFTALRYINVLKLILAISMIPIAAHLIWFLKYLT